MSYVLCVQDKQGYKYTNSGCVIVIAFPQQKWFQGSASVLSYIYVHYLSCFILLSD